MPRRKPFSNKQKKAQLQNKRATKRGDDEPTPAPKPQPRAKRPGRSDPPAARLALESRFVSIPKDYLERTRDIAFSDPLERPLPDSAAIFPLHLVANPAAAQLTVPARPKFRYGQTKKEVERNEEGVFRKWMVGVRGTVEVWVADGNWARGEQDEQWIHSPSWFETNLEVWRQLWRVVESSAILLLLIDARCPPVHCPPSLRAYLRSLKPRRQIILVLTKADLVDAEALEGWKRWLREWWCQPDEMRESRKPPRHGQGQTPRTSEIPDDGSDVQVVSVSSYDTSLLHGPGRTRHRPEIPDSAREALVAALRTAHERLLTPPQWAVADSEKLAGWTPSVRSEVHWDELAELDVEAGIKVIGKKAKGSKEREAQTSDAGGAEDSETDSDDNKDEDATTPPTRDPSTEPLTIGLVGQPNVGKSSLLNALLGTTRVRASKTPGKTKHFQTILWGARREIKIVDCPGLVCPSLVPMELQAMAGILPISQIPSLPSCIHFAARHMPLEDIFRVPAPEIDTDDIESKKTWREPRADAVVASNKTPIWTAGGIMEARALDRGFLTAKGGRPDANRAGNAMLRTLADGRVRWGFWPPGTRPVRDGRGVWLGALSEDALNAEDGDGGVDHGVEQSDDESSEASGDESNEGSASGDEEDENDEDEEKEDGDDGFVASNNRSFFAALDLGDDDDDEDEEDDDDDEEEESE